MMSEEIIELSSEDEIPKKIEKKKLKTLRKDPKQLSLKNFIKTGENDYFKTHKTSSLPAQVIYFSSILFEYSA